MAPPKLIQVMADASTRRDEIRRKALEGLTQSFPLKTKTYAVELHNPHVEDQVFSSREQKQALLEGRTLTEKVRGDLVVKDLQGTVVNTANNFTLLHLPYFTPRHTFIVDGTEYSVSNQLRTKPGVYTRRRGNEELEATFNLSKGTNFRLLMDPEKGLLYTQPTHTTSRIPLYPVLRSLGVPHQDIAAHWGADVAEVNKATYKNHERHFEKFYSTFLHPSQQTHQTFEEKVSAIHEYLNNTAMDPEVNRKTLGQAFEKVTPQAMLTASQKLLNVHRDATDTDDRDSLQFKTFHSAEDFIKERIILDARGLKTKLGIKLDAHKGEIRKALPAGAFSRSIKNFLTNSSLAAVPTQINPTELIDHSVRVTSLGEGAISTERAIPLEARNIHSSHFGIMDPAKSPESFKIGIDIRTAIGTRRDEHGNLYGVFHNIKSGKLEPVSVSELAHSVVAFPGEDVRPGKMVDAMKDGGVHRVSASTVNYQVPHAAYLYGPTTNLLPFVNGMQGNRTLMASKHMAQALPLVHREAPLVQVASWSPNTTVEREMVKLIVPTAPVAGRIEKIDDDYIYLRPHAGEKTSEAPWDGPGEFYSNFVKESAEKEKDGLIRLHYDTNFPLAAKTYLHNSIKVKEGDTVAAGQPLADSNYTKDDTLALGVNLRTAFMAYRGFNSNDGIVISEGAADKLVSEHMYKYILLLETGVEATREKHRAYYGNKYTAKQYSQLDEDGAVRPGTAVAPHDILVAAVRENQITGNAAMLGKLSKSLIRPFMEAAVVWDHDVPGEVIDVVKTSQRITVTVKTHEPMRIGDKLSGRYGNKGVVSKIIPNHQMVQDEKGRPIDLLFTSVGIVTRINPAQVVEAALGKVAEHTGKPIAVEQFAQHDNVQYAKDMLAKHGLKDKENVFDPVTNKTIPGVFVGKSYIVKLFKTTDSNWAAHGAGRYDFNQQPARGGDDGAKAIGKMEFDGLVAHNARNILRESASIKSQKNDEFWRAIQLGLPTPGPQTPFAYDKFLNLIQGAGIKVSKQGSRLTLGPLTDNDITKMSSGVLKDPQKLLRAKDLQPERGGLFDPAVTGGTAGTKWSHVDLHEPMVNPVFEEPVRRLLGLTQKEFQDLHDKHGGSWFHRELKKIDVGGKLGELKAQTKDLKGPALDGAVKQIKYLSALQAQNLTPHAAYVLSKIPVTPPVIRPALPLQDGRLQISDANLLYRDAFLANQQLADVKGVLPADELHGPRRHLYEAVGAVFGTHDPVSPTSAKRGAKGYLTLITGTRPGDGFFQSKLMKRQQDVSGRATIAPDPTLSMDEVGLPEDMLWGMYDKFLIGRLVRKGYSAIVAQKMVEDKNPIARQELVIEASERPVLINRAPSLHRFNVVAAYPKLISGKTLMLNPFAERGMNADYDGDTMQVHAPVTPGGIADAKKMTLSNLIFADRRPGMLNVAPEMEAVIGLHRATAGKSDGKPKYFASHADALAAYHKGNIELHDNVEIKK